MALANGEIWRLWTVTLVHAAIYQNPLHLLFNMYALWLAGPLVERMYGRWRFLGFYVLFALGGSLVSFAFSDARGGVGASGAVFGLFGLLFAAQRIHRPIIDRQARAFMGQLGGLLVINLIFGLVVPNIDNMAHLGRPRHRPVDGLPVRADARPDAALAVAPTERHRRAGAGVRRAGLADRAPRRPAPRVRGVRGRCG